MRKTSNLFISSNTIKKFFLNYIYYLFQCFIIIYILNKAIKLYITHNCAIIFVIYIIMCFIIYIKCTH